MENLHRQYLGPDRSTCDRTVDVSSNWSGSAYKRAFDLICALLALILLSPLLLAAAIAVKLGSAGPVLFKQIRMGRLGQAFTIYKFRTMRVQQPGEGPSVTRKGDNRLTRTGAIMRRVKIDELPQLFNVIKGDMSLVGDRPKLPHHMTYQLVYRPGITGAASLAFRNEETILHEVSPRCLDSYQVQVMMPLKKHLDCTYMQQATFLSDLRILLATALGRGKRLDHMQLQRFQESLVSLDRSVRLQYSPAAPSESKSPTLTADAA